MNILEKIVEQKKKDLEKEKIYTIEDVKNIKPVNVYDKFKISDKPFLISEIKRASPSEGDIKVDVDVVEQAKIYEKCGASCISVLTETNYFKGSFDLLKTVKQKVKIPVLSKDFIFTQRQIYQAAVYQADMILLIAAILNDTDLEKLYNIAGELGLTVLVEVHNEEELKRVLKLNPRIIGINNRNLKTFEIDIETTVKLKKLIPDDIIVISESGISEFEQVKYLVEKSVDGFLIGTSLMKSGSPADTIFELFGNYWS